MTLEIFTIFSCIKLAQPIHFNLNRTAFVGFFRFEMRVGFGWFWFVEVEFLEMHFAEPVELNLRWKGCFSGSNDI